MTRHGESGTRRPYSAVRAHESAGSRLTPVAYRVDTKQWPAWPPWPRRLWQGAVRGAPAVVVIGVTGLGLYLWAPDGDTLRIPAAVGAATFAFHVLIRLLAPLGRSRAGRIAASAAAGAVLGVVSGHILHSWERGPYWLLVCTAIGLVLGRREFKELYDD